MQSRTEAWLWGMVLAALLPGCGREAGGSGDATPGAPVAVETGSGGWPSTNVPAADRLTWRRRTLVEAYNAVGERNDRWDRDAREALESYSKLSMGADREVLTALDAASKRATDAGCSDPLVAYLRLRFVHGSPERVDMAGADAYRGVADKLMDSGYPDIRKFYAAVRAAEAWKGARGSTPETAQMLSHLRRGAFAHLRVALQEPDLPFIEAYEAADALRGVILTNDRQENDILPVLIDCFEKRWPQEARSLTLRGRSNIRLAWNRRGAGYAATVNDEGWKEFARYLGEAERLLERSWELDYTVPDAAESMLEVELGQGKGRDRMELWFKRAMTVDPACYSAAFSKAWYLQPKWHGSAKEALAFGRECVQSKEWKGRVPLILVEAHDMLANDEATGLKDAHWRQAGVWEDVRDSFERFFELNPGETGWRHNYALYAYKCGQFDRFLDLVRPLEPMNHTIFGGEAAFAGMVAEAEQKTGRKAGPAGK